MRTNNTNTMGNSNSIVTFSFESHAVRGFEYKGEAHFIGNEVADALGYTNASKALNDHCKSLKKINYNESLEMGLTEQGKNLRGISIIPERDVYRMVMRSNLPTAEAFEEKVVGEILPAIRKTGGYMVAVPEETPEEIMLRALTIAKETVDRQKIQIVDLAPKAAALDAISEAEGDMGVRDAGRELDGIGQTKVVASLIQHKWACREGRKLKPAHYGLSQGYVRLVPKPYQDRHTGETCIGHDFKITARGLARLAIILCGASSAAAHRLNGMKEKKATPAPFSKASA